MLNIFTLSNVREVKFKVKYGQFPNLAILTANTLVSHSALGTPNRTEAHQLLKPFTYPTCKRTVNQLNVLIITKRYELLNKLQIGRATCWVNVFEKSRTRKEIKIKI